MANVSEEKGALKGKIFDIQGFSVQDGPGIRTTVFFKGCPLRCPWCHSPESQEFYTQLNWMELRCVGIEKCGKCLGACPNGAITPGVKKEMLDGSGEYQLIHVDRSKCDDCGKCAEACIAQALYLCGKDYTVDEVMEYVHRDVPFYRHSGGGVTLSGGECLCQPEFVLALLKRCKAEDIHTAIDTTGFVKWEVIESILPYSDLFLYDIKGFDSALHKQVTGVPNEPILENARRIAAAGGKFQIRIPLMPMYNDSVEAMEQMGRFCLELGDAVEMVQILPYHKYGISKWDRLMTDKPVFEAELLPDELVEARRAQLEDMGLNVSVH